MTRAGGRTAAVLLVAASVLAGCSPGGGDGDGGEGGTAGAPSCRLPQDLSRTAVLLDRSDRAEVLLAADLDAHAVTVVCDGLGGVVGDLEAPLTLAGEPYRQVQGPATGNAAWLPVSADLVYAVAGDDLVDLRTGERAPITRSQWAPAYPTGTGAVVMAQRSAVDSERVRDPASWCVLPRAGAAAEECAPVPGASGPGTPVVAADGAVGWAPTAGVPLRAGPITAGAATGAAGRWAAAEVLPPGRADRSTTGVWLDAGGTSAVIDPSTADDVAGGDGAPVTWLTELTIGPDGAAGRYLQSEVDYTAVAEAVGGPGSGGPVPVVDGVAVDGADGVVLAVRSSTASSLVRVRAGSGRPELVWDGRAAGDALPVAALLRVPVGGDDPAS